ncbi:MAG: NAD(P)H-dependent oxidoreductase [Proteobacteria bacterium]|nr:NAD(P)H-dependent oxidoreductase [Pseudomonadota bacterium]
MKVLQIDSSIQGEGSASRLLTREIVANELARHPGATVVYRDLAAEEPQHLSAALLSGREPAEAARSADRLEEFLAADVIVIGAPIYNFTIPSQLKAWIDRIAVAGKTFRYSAAGPEGLVRGKRVIVAVSRGGVHAPGTGEFAESYLRFLFGFLGIEDVSFVRAQGLSISPQHRALALAEAVAAIAAPVRLAA